MLNGKTRWASILFLALGGGGSMASAATILSYNMEAGDTASTTTTAASVTPDTQAAGVTGSTFTAGAGLVGVSTGTTPETGLSTSYYSSSNHSYFTRSALTAASESTAVSGNSYLTFSLTVNSGTVNVGNLTFNEELYDDVGGTPSFIANFDVMSSLTGFATGKSLGTFTDTWSSNPTAPGIGQFIPRTINLSANPSFQNLGPGTYEFRIYVYDNDNTTTANNVVERIDDVSLNTTPEPSSLATLAVGCLFALKRRRA